MSRFNVLAAAVVLAACSHAPSPDDFDRVVEDPARGVRYTCPAGWKATDGEIRSKTGSLLTLRVYDLVVSDYCGPRCAEMAHARREPQTPNCECDHPMCRHSGHS